MGRKGKGGRKRWKEREKNGKGKRKEGKRKAGMEGEGGKRIEDGKKEGRRIYRPPSAEARSAADTETDYDVTVTMDSQSPCLVACR